MTPFQPCHYPKTKSSNKPLIFIVTSRPNEMKYTINLFRLMIYSCNNFSMNNSSYKTEFLIMLLYLYQNMA